MCKNMHMVGATSQKLTMARSNWPFSPFLHMTWHAQLCLQAYKEHLGVTRSIPRFETTLEHLNI